jgi:hypothetical protein
MHTVVLMGAILLFILTHDVLGEIIYSQPHDIDMKTQVRVNPTKGVFDTTYVSLFRLPASSLKPITWDVGTFTGLNITKELREKAQLGFYPDHYGSTAVQYKDGVMGAHLNTYDTHPIGASLATITIDYNWSPSTRVSPWRTTNTSLLHLSLNTQVPTADRRGIAVYTSVSIALAHIPSGRFVWYETAIFDLHRPLGNFIQQDTFTSGAIIHGVLDDKPNPYHTALPGCLHSQQDPWKDLRQLNITISAQQFQQGIKDANRLLKIDLPTDVHEWTIVNLNVEVEATDMCRAGHTVSDLKLELI